MVPQWDGELPVRQQLRYVQERLGSSRNIMAVGVVEYGLAHNTRVCLRAKARLRPALLRVALLAAGMPCGAMGGIHVHWGVWKPAQGQQPVDLYAGCNLQTARHSKWLRFWFVFKLLCFTHTLLLLQVKDIDQYQRNVAACSIKPATTAAKAEDLGTFMVTNGHATAYRSVGLTAQWGSCHSAARWHMTWHCVTQSG